MAGAMKKAGYTVESFKPENGERTTASTRSIGSPPFRPPGSGRGGLFCFCPRLFPLLPDPSSLGRLAKLPPPERT